VSADQARRAGLGDAGGALVNTLYRDDPAARAGLRPGDIIVSFNKKPITEQSQLQRLIADAPTGSTATLDVIRVGVAKTIDVPIVRAPQSGPVRR
jgi:serine protease Do